MTNAENTDDLVLFANTISQAESLLYYLVQTPGGSVFFVNANKTEFVCFTREGTISILCEVTLKFADLFIYLTRHISSTETDGNIRVGKICNVIDRLSIMWKSDVSDKVIHNSSQAVVVSVLQYRCTTWKQRKHTKKKLNES